MKLSVNVGPFIKAISPAVEVASKNGLKEFEGVGKINFEVKDKKELLVSSFGGRTSVEATLSDLTVDNTKFEFLADGKFTVEADLLVKTLASFDPDDQITLEYDSSGNKELVISRKADASENQKLPTSDMEVVMPEKAEKFVKTLKIKRDIFLSAATWVNFAIGFEEQSMWLYWPLRIAGNKKVRAIAGYGGRLAGKDIEGADLVDCSPATTNFLLSKDHTPLVTKLLNSVPDETVEFKQSDPKNGPYQMVVKTGTYELTLTNMAPNIQWPDENALLNLGYNQKFVVKVSDLLLAAKGTSATFHEGLVKDRKPHVASVTVDFANKLMTIETNEIMKSSRKVPILDSAATLPKIEFKCVSMFLNEIAQKGERDGYIQIEALGPDKPIVAYFNAAEKVSDPSTFKKVNNLTKIGERTFLLFAPLTKDY